MGRFFCPAVYLELISKKPNHKFLSRDSKGLANGTDNDILIVLLKIFVEGGGEV